MQVLATFERFLGMPFDKATKRDLQEAVINLDSAGYKPHYLHDLKVTIRKFYKWLKKTEDGYPEEVKWIHTVISRRQRRMLPDALLSEEHVSRLVNACRSVRDRAIIAVLYDSGCRISEIRTLRIKSVRFDSYGAIIQVSGKTGDRRVRLTISVPMLATWINMHPRRDNPEAPLWPTSRGDSMRYASFGSLIRRTARLAGIKTRVYAHLFRHSRATFLASYLTEAQQCAHFGWVQGSEQPGTYVHLSGRDVDDALLRLYGFKKDRGQDIGLLAPRPCPRCNLANAFNCRVCVSCGSNLQRQKDRNELESGSSLPALTSGQLTH